MSDIQPIRATFEIIRIQTMASGAIRYTFETAEHELDLMQKLAECRLRGALLEAAMLPITPVKQENIRKDAEVQARSERKSERQTAEDQNTN